MAQQTPPFDLSRCDEEPIHVPGSIQPHGVLLTLEPSTLAVLQVAGDTRGLLGLEIGSLLHQDIEAVLGAEAAALIRASVTPGLSEPQYLGTLASPAEAGRRLDLIAHVRDGLFILEFEPAADRPATAAQMLAGIRRIGLEMDDAPDLPGLFRVACREARRLTGYGRVMVYRFFEDGTGMVAAEDRRPEFDSLLNHHYPASDIPQQARSLYLRNLIRTIPDAGYVPAPVMPANNPATGKPLDMSDCTLRSVSPIHLQYLKNLNVAASMSVSIVVDGVLWGLLSCHDSTPRQVPYERRELCKHLGQLLAQQIKAREGAERHQQALRLAAVREELIKVLARADSLEQGLADHLARVRQLLPADGAAVLLRGQVGRIGHTPTEAQIRELGGWLLGPGQPEPFVTQNLARVHAPAEAYAAEASGVLATVVSHNAPIVLFWFRAEHIETINWAGNPHKPAEPGEEPGVLTPRRSFEDWKETVRQQSLPWSVAEVDAARRLGRGLLELRLQDTLRGLNAQLQRTLADREALLTQKDLLMQEVHHRVQNSLQLVNSILFVQARQSSDAEVKASFEEASRRILAVSTVHSYLWRHDQIQAVEFGAYLSELRDALVGVWGVAWAEQIQLHVPHMLVPTHQAVILGLVLTELLTNAVKYAYEGAPGPIDVILRDVGHRSLRVSVKDQGVGMQQEVAGSGLGSRLTRSLIAQLGGELEVVEHSPGTCVVLTVPLTAETVSAG